MELHKPGYESELGCIVRVNTPNGVSTSAVWYNSSIFVATHSAGRVSNTPRGWHRSKSSWVSRSCSVLVMSSITLSIMHAYLEHTRQYQRRIVTRISVRTYVMYSKNLLSGLTALVLRKLNRSAGTWVAFSAMVEVEMGESSLARKLS